jgi:Flp pilus assembly protein TadG
MHKWRQAVSGFQFRNKHENGQSFIELAVSMVFLLTLLAAMIDLGWAFYEMTALNDMAQEAASFGSLYPCKGDVSTINMAEIRARLKDSATAPLDSSQIPDQDITIQIINAAGEDAPAALGNSVRVSVTIQHKILTPFLGMFIGNNWQYPLTATASNVILKPVCRP